MPAQTSVTVRMFTQRLSSTRKGARLARLLAAQQLDEWGCTYGSTPSDSAAAIVAELAANAVLHGRVPGRDFELRLSLIGTLLRIEVSDARTERLPQLSAGPSPESGRGLLLVSALAAEWGTAPRLGVGKTVWASLDLCCG
jgi:anti-sigma regulatory factor (Ser/Thr protein kinase)